ncbi:MAG: hypothetical protein D6815_07925, partial [Candidatus Dadabacteria bacterium]
MAGGRKSSWADAVTDTLGRLDVADTIEQLRRQVDELIGRFAEEETEAKERAGGSGAGALERYIEELSRKIDAANDLLAEVADVLDAQGERIETIEQQLDGAGETAETSHPGALASSAASSPERATEGAREESLLEAVGALSELLCERFDRIEERLRSLESRLDDVLTVVGERQRQLEELEERLLILSAAGPRPSESRAPEAAEAPAATSDTAAIGGRAATPDSQRARGEVPPAARGNGGSV